MAESNLYGVMKSGPRKGLYTLCKAHDMATCPYHADGSHMRMTADELDDANESLALKSQIETNPHLVAATMSKSSLDKLKHTDIDSVTRSTEGHAKLGLVKESYFSGAAFIDVIGSHSDSSDGSMLGMDVPESLVPGHYPIRWYPEDEDGQAEGVLELDESGNWDVYRYYENVGSQNGAKSVIDAANMSTPNDTGDDVFNNGDILLSGYLTLKDKVDPKVAQLMDLGVGSPDSPEGKLFRNQVTGNPMDQSLFAQQILDRAQDIDNAAYDKNGDEIADATPYHEAADALMYLLPGAMRDENRRLVPKLKKNSLL